MTTRRPTAMIWPVLCATTILAACGDPGTSVPPGEPAMFRGAPAHTGVFVDPGVEHLGTVAWRFETGGPVRSSPTVSGDTVYVGSADGHLYAVDRATGVARWRFDAASPVDSSPAVARGLVVFQSRDGAIRALDQATGTTRWSVQTGPDRPWEWGHEGWDYYISSPVVAGDLVFIGSGDGYLYALALETGRQVWRFGTDGRIRSSPAVADDLVYVGSADGSLYAVDRASGTRRWRFDTHGKAWNSADFGYDRKTLISSPAVDGGTVYIGSRDGRMYAVHADSGEERWNLPSETTWAISSPAVQDGVVFSGRSDQRYVHAVRASSGEEIWRFVTGHYVFSSPAVAGSTVYAGSADGALRAFDASTGDVRWALHTEGPIYSSPAVADRVVYVGSDDGGLYAVEASDGPSPKLGVYWDEARTSRSFFTLHEDVRRYFATVGYEVLDASALRRFLEDRLEDHAPSVVVFAIDDVPPSVASEPSPTSLIRRYLDDGGKIVWLGLSPFLIERDEQGRAVGFDRSRPAQLLGVDHARVNTDEYGAWVTPAGKRWGLAGWRVMFPGVHEDQVSIVLARGETGTAAAWVREYGGPPGTGFVQLWPTRKSDELAMIRRVAEYGILRRVTP